MRKLIVGVLGAAAALPLFAKIELGTPFADQAVLQRGMKVPVWGRATPGSEVTVAFAGQEKSATAGADGAWRVDLDPLVASKEGRVLSVTECEPGWFGSTVDEVEVRDVLVGEVWFASGQSNMDCPVWTGGHPRYRDGNGALVTEMANMTCVRWFKCPWVWSVSRNPIKATWRRMVAADLRAKPFSAVAFYYARELYLALDIPIGIVDASWGGTNIDAWTPRSGYSDCDASIRDVADYPVKPAGQWTEKDRVGPIRGGCQQPTVLFNGLVASWTPMAMRGFIWYQGCHNHGESERYRVKLHALYNGWSREFRNPNLRMYLAQLAPCSQNWNVIAAGQNQFAAEQPNAAVAVLADIGNFSDIHPNRKETVGKRLAVHALKRDYGFDIPEDDSPTLKAVVYSGATAELTFDHAKRLYIYADDRSLRPAFELAGEDGVWADARIVNLETKDRRGKPWQTGYIGDGNKVVLQSDKVPAPKHVRYMAKPRTAGTVYNEMSLPLGVFEK